MVLNVNTLPEPLHRRFRSSRVRVHEENGIVTLTPISDPDKDDTESLEQISQRRLAFMGCLEGEVWMADDFDEPLEEMKEYME